MIMGKKDTETTRLSAEAIKEMKQKAFGARDKLNLLPTYTPFRICDLVQVLGIDIKDE